MVTAGNENYHGDHFAVYTNIKLLCYTPEINIMLYVNYTSVFKKRRQIPSLSHSRKAKSLSDIGWICWLCKHLGNGGGLLCTSGACLRIMVSRCLS